MALGACSTPVKEFDFDIEVGGNVVLVYTGNADVDCSCRGNDFPAADDCVSWSDVKTCTQECHSCISDLGLEMGGVRVASAPADSRAVVANDISLRSDVELVIAGCGHGPARIPLQISAYPMPTVTVLDVDPVTVGWTTDIPAVSALVSNGNDFVGQWCRAEGTNTFTFSHSPGSGSTLGVSVFAEVPTYVTPLGTARVWSGNGSSTMVP